MTTGSGLSVLVIDRSAMPTVVVAVAELFAALLSLGDETVAVLLIVPAVDGAVTTIVKLALVFFTRVARVQVTVVVPEHAHPVPLAETNVVPAGSVSTTLTEVASMVVDGFVTAIV